MTRFDVVDGSTSVALSLEPQPNGDVFVNVDGSYLVTFRAGESPKLLVAEKWLNEKGIGVEIQTS